MPTYDYKCHVLAVEFLEDYRKITTPEREKMQDKLAQAIQDAIETWISESGLED